MYNKTSSRFGQRAFKSNRSRKRRDNDEVSSNMKKRMKDKFLQILLSKTSQVMTREEFPCQYITSKHHIIGLSPHQSSPDSHSSPEGLGVSHDQECEDESDYLLKQFYLNSLLNIDPQHQMDIKEEKVNCLHKLVVTDKAIIG